jgi:hypothetical protein
MQTESASNFNNAEEVHAVATHRQAIWKPNYQLVREWFYRRVRDDQFVAVAWR